MALDSNNIQLNFDATINDVDVAPGAFDSARKTFDAELDKLFDSDKIFDDFYKGLPKLEQAGKAAFKELGTTLGQSLDIEGEIKKITDKLTSFKQEVGKDAFKSLDSEDVSSLVNALEEGAKEGQALASKLVDVEGNLNTLRDKASELQEVFAGLDDNIYLQKQFNFDELGRQLGDSIDKVNQLKGSFDALKDDKALDLNSDISSLLDYLNTLEAEFNEVRDAARSSLDVDTSKQIAEEQQLTDTVKEREKAYEQTEKATAKEKASAAKREKVLQEEQKIRLRLRQEEEKAAQAYEANKQREVAAAEKAEREKTKAEEKAFAERERVLQAEQRIRLGIQKTQEREALAAQKQAAAQQAAQQREELKKTTQQINIGNALSRFVGNTGAFGTLISSLSGISAGFVGVGAAVAGLKATYTIINKFTTLTLNMVSSVGKGLGTLLTTFAKFTIEMSGIKRIVGVIRDAFVSMGNAVKSLVGNISFTDLIKQSSELASALVEVQNRVDVVFGESLNIINSFATTALKKLGMTTLATKQFAAGFGAALTSAGQSTENINSMSIALTKLTADMASFYDISQDLAYEKLFSGVISGQVKAMRSLGVDMTVNSLSAYALAKGYQTAYREMDAATKAAIRYQYVMEKLSYVHGDYERTITSTANQLRLLKNSLKELGTVIGAIINTFLNPLLRILNTILSSVVAVAKAIADVMGIDWSGGVGAGVSTLGDLSDEYDDLAGSAEDFANSEEGATDSLHNLNKAAKNALSPLHKLNVLQNKNAKDNKKNSKLGAGVGIGVDAKTTGQLPNLRKALEGFFNWLWSQDWEGKTAKLVDRINAGLAKLPQAFKNLRDALQPWVQRSVELLNQFIDGIHWDDLGRTVNEAMDVIARSVRTALETFDFDNAGKKFADFVNGFTEDADLFKDVGASIALAIQGAFDFVYQAVNNINWGILGERIWDLVHTGLLYLDPKKIEDTITSSLNGISKAIISFFENLNKHEGDKKKIAQLLTSFIVGAATYLGGSDFSLLVDNISKFIADELKYIKAHLDKTGAKENIKNGIAKVLQEAGKLLKNKDLGSLVADVFDVVSKALTDFFASKDIPLAFKLKAADVVGWDTILEIMAVDKWNEIKADVEYLVSKISGGSTAVQKFADGLKEVLDTLNAILHPFDTLVTFMLELERTDGNFAEAWRNTKTAINEAHGELLSFKGALDTATYGWSSQLTEANKVLGIITEQREAEEYRNAVAIEGAAEVQAAQQARFDAEKQGYVSSQEYAIAKDQVILDSVKAREAAEEAAALKVQESNKISKESGIEAGTALADAFTDLGAIIMSMFTDVDGEFTDLPSTAKEAMANVASAIDEDFLTPMGTSVQETASGIKESFDTLVTDVTTSWGNLSSNISDNELVKVKGSVETTNGEIYTLIEKLLADILEATNTNTTELQTGITTFLTELTTSVEDTLTTLETDIKTFVDNSLKAIEEAVGNIGKQLDDIDSRFEKLNSSVTSWADKMAISMDKAADSATKLAEKLRDAAQAQRDYNDAKRDKERIDSRPYSSPNYPRYANGAVLQPNKPHLAIVGDQKSGLNVETPVAVIEDAVAKGIASAGGTGNVENITIPVYVDGQLTSTKVITAEQLYNYRSNGR